MLVLLLIFILASPVPAEDHGKITMGAIRWDGWFQDNPWEKFLVPAQWHDRLPFYGSVISASEVQVCSDSQEVMDQEIDYAHSAGLSYFAFCYYHPKAWQDADQYNYGWKRYLSSSRRGKINFCLILQHHLGSPSEWNETIKTFVSFFREPTYQKVLENRPLVFLFGLEKCVEVFGSVEAGRKAWEQLRITSQAEGTGNPYLVAQNTTWEVVDQYGFDAAGAYTLQGSEGGFCEQPFQRLAADNCRKWQDYLTPGRHFVPLINAGWDPRPRYADTKQADSYGQNPWFSQPTPVELADHLRSGLNWTREHPHSNPAQTLLIYAWNETDEGGWLVPTHSEGNSRLKAISQVLKDQ